MTLSVPAGTRADEFVAKDDCLLRGEEIGNGSKPLAKPSIRIAVVATAFLDVISAENARADLTPMSYFRAFSLIL